VFSAKRAFSGFSVDDLAKAKEFYSDILGLKMEPGMGLNLHLPGGGTVFVYPKKDHQPATFTVLNLAVDNIDAAVDALKARGLTFEHYEGMPQDERGIMRAHGPSIAWFKDPAGNILSVIEENPKKD
jgi:catechol 2,3-dioxygenase-like lactoylglutathione lyase family enzyme